MATIASSRVAPSNLAQQQGAVAASHPYTCNTCQVAFRNSELQRGHMRSDWHRYNLKRRVSSLPPITSEVFTEKVLAAQASSTAAANRATYEQLCEACNKTYFSENAYINHLSSQKHKTKAAAAVRGDPHDDDASSVISSQISFGAPISKRAVEQSSDDDVDEIADAVQGASLEDVTAKPSPQVSSASTPRAASVANEEKECNVNRCLFCNYDSPTLALNVNHMQKIHGMFIPERDYLVDLEGLIKHLHQKINYFHECLYCGKLNPSIPGLQTHMRDKSHCQIPYETEQQQLDIGDFYDFRSTYSDSEEEWEDEEEDDDVPSRRAAKLGASRKPMTDNEGDEKMEGAGADGWETDSDESSLDSEDLTAVPKDQRTHMYERLNRHPHHSSEDPRSHRSKDGFHSHAHKHTHTAFYSEHELHLPTGRSVGHRAHAKYFRQNLHNYPSQAEREERLAIEGAPEEEDEEEQSQGRSRALISRADGGLGMVGVSEQQKKAVRAVEKRAQKEEQRGQRRAEWRLNKQNNSQKHFRDPLLQ